MKNLYTSESISYGHPDKIADIVAEVLVEEFLKQDKNSRCGIEVMVKDNIVILGGEVNSTAKVDYDTIVRGVFEWLNFPSNHHLSKSEIKIINLIGKQSEEIHKGVDKTEEEIGSGDQGICYGYADNSTLEYMPLANQFARDLWKRIIKVEGLGPDIKTQCTVNENNEIVQINVSTMHTMELETVRYIVSDIIDKLILDKYPSQKYHEIEKIINLNGEWHIGGPVSDCGITGRKLVADFYGSACQIGGGATCVDGDTEYLGEDLKWHKISNYTKGKIAQWDEGKLTFVQPLHYHVHDAEKMYHIKSEERIDMVLSEHHDVVIETSKGNIIKKMVKDLIENNHIKNGNAGTIPMFFKYEAENEGISLTDDEIRLQIAFCADGNLKENGSGRIRVKKDYKKERLELLLKNTQIEYKTSIYDYDKDFTYYRFRPIIKSKSLYECFSKCNSHQMEVIAKEVVLWDGDRKKTFRTTIKEDADFIQFIFMSVYNTNSSIYANDRIGGIQIVNGKEYIRKSKAYTITSLETKHGSLKYSKDTNKTKVEEFVPLDKKMYCFTVPSSILVLRRNNHVFITGNCGKDLSKVDKSGALMARYLAKNIVAASLADSTKISLGYIISKPTPVSMSIEMKNGKVDSDELIDWINNNVDLSVKGMIEKFSNVSFSECAKYGYFCNNDYPWEKLDLVGKLKERFSK